jgi:hypothetical protein
VQHCHAHSLALSGMETASDWCRVLRASISSMWCNAVLRGLSVWVGMSKSSTGMVSNLAGICVHMGMYNLVENARTDCNVRVCTTSGVSAPYNWASFHYCHRYAIRPQREYTIEYGSVDTAISCKATRWPILWKHHYVSSCSERLILKCWLSTQPIALSTGKLVGV